MQGGKLKAAWTVVSSPNLKNVFHRENYPTDNSSSARTSRAASNVSVSCAAGVWEKSNVEGEGAVDGCSGDIKVHNRVAEEILRLSPSEKKGWWLPHPDTGIYVPQTDSKRPPSACSPRMPYASVDELEKIWIRSAEDLGEADP